MASALFTVQDGALAAQTAGNGQNVTAGNTITLALTDITGVTGWQIRSIWNNQNLNDATLSAGFTVNQSTGVATIPSSLNLPAGTAMILYSEILSSTLIPSTPRAYVGLLFTGQGAYRVQFPVIPSPISLQALIAFMQDLAQAPQISGNFVTCTNVSTIANQAAPSSFFVAAALLTVRQSGFFRVDIDLGFSDNTTADSVTVALVTDTSASGVLASATKSAVGWAGYNAGTLLTQADLEVCTGATAISYNGAAFTTAPIVQRTNVFPTLTGLLTGSAIYWGFHGIVGNAISTARTPFVFGNTVGFGIKVSATNTLTFPEFSMTVIEL